MKKKNLLLIISAIVILLIGVALLVIFNLTQGISIVDMLTSKWAIAIEVAIGLYAVIVLAIILKDWYKRW